MSISALPLLEPRSHPSLHIRAASLDDVLPILTLHQEAFADKFGGAFGEKGITKGVAAMEAAWHRQGISALRGMLVAEWQGQVIGTAMLRTHEMGTDKSGSVDLAFQQTLGLWGATRSMFALSLLSHAIGRGEGFITDVAVLKPFRRQGVAQALLKELEQQARYAYGKTYLGLYVSSINEGARMLYVQYGFRKVAVRRSWMTRFIFGQREWFYMRKTLF